LQGGLFYIHSICAEKLETEKNPFEKFQRNQLVIFFFLITKKTKGNINLRKRGRSVCNCKGKEFRLSSDAVVLVKTGLTKLVKCLL